MHRWVGSYHLEKLVGPLDAFGPLDTKLDYKLVGPLDTKRYMLALKAPFASILFFSQFVSPFST